LAVAHAVHSGGYVVTDAVVTLNHVLTQQFTQLAAQALKDRPAESPAGAAAQKPASAGAGTGGAARKAGRATGGRAAKGRA
jgi:hypothetical protein